MSDEEAKSVLTAEVTRLRPSGYEELVERLAGRQEAVEVVGLSGTAYHVEIEGFWDDKEHRNLRIVASIDDGGLRALLPFTDSFTVDPSGAITDHSAP